MRKYYSMETSGREATVTIYGDITSEPMSDSETSSWSLAEQIRRAGDVDRINVRINSYGGECSEALAIANALMRSPAEVWTYNDGFACSAAATVFMAGDHRVASRYCSFLFHNAWSAVTGNSADLRTEADNLDAITRQSVELYLSRTNLSEAELLQLMSEERFLTPEEALRYGFATEIEDVSEAGTASQSARALIMDRMAQSRENTTSDDLIHIVAQATLEGYRARMKEEPVHDTEAVDDPEAEEDGCGECSGGACTISRSDTEPDEPEETSEKTASTTECAEQSVSQKFLAYLNTL